MQIKYLLVSTLLLISSPAFALGVAKGGSCSPPNCTSIYNAGNNGLNGPATVAQLPAAGASTNLSYTVTDWNGTSPCNGHGGGSTRVICISDGVNWNPQVGAAGTQDSTYTPTTSTDWSVWTTAPATLKQGLDKTASFFRALFVTTFGHYDSVVDVTNSITWKGLTPTSYAGPCQALSRSLDSYLQGSTTAPWRVRWVGSMSINPASTASYLSNEYGVCVPVVPASSYSSDFPVMSSVSHIDGQKLIIDWDGLDVTYTPTAQTKPIVFMQLGNLYGVGFQNLQSAGNSDSAFNQGYVSNGITIRGNASVTVASGSSAGWTAGVVPQLPFDATNAQMSQTSFIAFFDSGLLRSNMGEASVACNGFQTDLDDVCWIHDMGWENTYPYIGSYGFATGIAINGNTVGTFPGGYIEIAKVGFISGGPLNIYSAAVSNNCLLGGNHCTRRSIPTSGWHLKNFTIEGNTLGNIVVADSLAATGEDIWTEMGGAETGDSMLIGAGFCNTIHTPCSQASQCVARGHGTLCQDPAPYSAGNSYGNGTVGNYYTDIGFIGLINGGDKGDTSADHLAFGPGFRSLNGNGRAVFGTGTYLGPIVDGGANNNQLFSFAPLGGSSSQINVAMASFNRLSVVKPAYNPASLIYGIDSYVLRYRTSNYTMNNIATANDGKFCFKEPVAETLIRVSAFTTANTATVNLYERSEASPNTGTTGLLSSDLSVSSTGTAATIAFADNSIAVNDPICLGIKATTMTATDVLNLTIQYQDQ